VPSSGNPQVNPWIVAVAVMFGTFMEVLDTTVVNVSLPHIAGNLSASIDEATWVLTSYLVANAIILPITGWLANFFGRKRLLMMSVTGFTIASFFCGFATSLPMLVVFRVIQGAAGGALQPLSQAVLLESFPPEKRGKAMGIWGLGIVVAPILGPVLGGWLTDSYSWRWVFYINIPVGVVCLLMTRAFVWDPPYIKRGSARIDYWGIGLLTVGVGALQIILDKGQQEDWFSSKWILGLLVTTLICLTAFIIRELKIEAPVVNLRVFRDRSFATGTLLMTVLGFVLYGSLVLLPIWLQTLLGYPSLQAGIALAPRGVGSFIAMPLVGILLAKGDPRKFLAGGITIGALTLFQLSRLDLSAGYWDFFWPQFIQGTSLALMFVPLTTVSMARIPREQMGNATSIFNLLRNMGGSIGIAGVTTMLERVGRNHMTTLSSHVTPFDSGSRATLEGLQGAFEAHGMPAATAAKQAYAALYGMMARQATMLSFVQVFRVLAGIFVLLLPLLMIMKRPPKSAPAPTGVH
jgi:MFS transporter, DHA2 family, multidrug resistance protein